MFHVVVKEVPLHIDVLGLLANLCDLGVSDRALVGFPDGGGPVHMLVEDLAPKLAEEVAFVGGVCC
jgi:hypothetical protein